MTHDIFISYSRRDLAAVKPIKEELERHGFSCWMDLEGIESGSEEFTEAIAEAIGGSTVVLFFLSSASQASRWSLNELRVARDDGKHVVLVRFNDDRMIAKFKLEFGGTDIIDWRTREQKRKLLSDLKKWTGGRNRVNTARPTPTIDSPETLADYLDHWLPWQDFRLIAGIKFRDSENRVSLTGHAVASPWGVFLLVFGERKKLEGRKTNIRIPSEKQLREFASAVADRCGLRHRRVTFWFVVPEMTPPRKNSRVHDWIVPYSNVLDRLKRLMPETRILDWKNRHREITKALETLPMSRTGLERNVKKHFAAKTIEEMEDGAALLAWVDTPSEALLDAAENACHFLWSNNAGDAAEGIRCWFRVMADRGNVLAMDHYGWLLEGSDENRVKWFQKAADLGGAHAQNSLGHCLHEGKGARQDRNEALRWFRASATQGNRFGQESLARAYAEPDFAGMPQDWTEAFRLYRLSAEQGWHWAQFHLGECFENGLGTQRNLQEARRWYEKAAEQLNEQARAALKRLSKKQ